MDTSQKLTITEIKQLGVKEATATKIIEILKNNLDSPENCWKQLTENILSPDMPAELHQKLFRMVYKQDEKFSDAPPAWFPDNETTENANLTKFLKKKNLNSYRALHHYSVSNRLAFWEDTLEALAIPFDKNPTKIADLSDGLESPEWLPGASLNIANACFQAPEDSTAIIYGTENGELNRMSYSELNALSSQIANGLVKQGFGKGDKAAINMPMTAEAVAIYLGIVKAGGAVVSIADSLAPAEVQKRLEIVGTQYIFTQDVLLRGDKQIPLYNKLLEAEIPKAIVLPAKDVLRVSLREGDWGWEDFLSEDTQFTAVSCTPEDHCNILFSSGTTGTPKAIPWTHTTPIKAATDGYFHQDIQPEEVVAWPTNIGWMMGPWLIFASLINRATIALFYGAPTGRAFGEFVQNAKVNMLGLVPSMVKRWLETGCMEGLDWSSIKLFSSTGESSNPQDYLWLMAQAGYRPVIEYCGGTEIGGGYLTNTVLQPASPATFSTPTLGIDLVILDDKAQPADAGEMFLIPPSIGLSTSLINKDHRKTYYDNLPHADESWQGVSGTHLGEQTTSLHHHPVLRRHGDEIRKLKNGQFRAQGRADDTMNLGGIKTSSVEIERLLDMIDGVHETAAIAVEPSSGGPKELVVYCVLNDGQQFQSEVLKNEFQNAIKQQLNPLFRVSDVVLRQTLPRTASNKIMRRVLRDEYVRQ